MNLLNLSKRFNRVSFINHNSNNGFNKINNRLITTTTTSITKSTTFINNSINNNNNNNNNNNDSVYQYILNNSIYSNSINSSNNTSLNKYYTSVSLKFKNIKNNLKKKQKKKVPKDFSTFGLSRQILDSINEKQWTKPTLIQSEVIPMIFKGRNVVFSSITGSGKTAAYALPFIQILSTFKTKNLEYLKRNQFNSENYQLFSQDEAQFSFKQQINNSGSSGSGSGSDNINIQNQSLEEYDDYEVDQVDENEIQDLEENQDSSVKLKSESTNENYQDLIEYEVDEEDDEEYQVEEIEESQVQGLQVNQYNSLEPNSVSSRIQYYEDPEEEEEYEIEEFDENGNLIQKSPQEISTIERLRKLKKRNEGKPFNEIDPIGVVLLPSKELALQVSKEIGDLVKNVQFDKEISSVGKLRVLTLVGGVAEKKQLEQLASGVDIVVGTPGRIVQLINQELISLQQVRMTVIDEFDKLFNLGFFPDIRDIFDFLPKVRSRTKRFAMQTVLTSATLNHKLDNIITRFAPNHLLVDLNNKLEAPSTLKQYFYHVNYRLKSNLLLYFLRRKGKTSLKNKKVLVFARTQQRVEKLTAMLKENKIRALSIHADLSISQRNRVLQMFKDPESTFDVLISTDVMARGVDIDNLEAVVNLDVPHVAEDYLHRVGRVGRNGREGFSLTFVSPFKQIFKIGDRTVGLDESHLIDNIEKSTGVKSRFSKIPGPWEENRKQSSGNYFNDNNNNQPNNSNNNLISNRNNSKSIKKNSTITERINNYGEDFGDEDDEDDYPKNQTKSNILDKETIYHKKQEKRAVTEILMKKNIIESYKGPATRDGLPRVKFNPNAKIKDSKISKIVIDRKGEIFDLPNITDFKEGQYHEVVNSFDKKRAIKRGIRLPPNQPHVFLPSKIETKRSLKNFEKNPTRYFKDSSLYNVKK